MYQDKALMLSDLDATNFELEQTALEDSMLAFAAEQGRKQRAQIFSGSMGSSGAPSAAASALAGASRSSRQRRGREDDEFFYGSSDAPLMDAPHDSLVPAAASSTTSPTAVSSTALASAHTAQSPPRFASDAARSDAAGGGGGIGGLDAMEYPETVQELVMNGFELSRVVRAYELIGDSFDDLLALLMSQQRRS
jgi:hypothetical protein